MRRRKLLRLTPDSKPGDESPIANFYLTYVTLRSMPREQTGKLREKPGVTLFAARFSTALPQDRAEQCLHHRHDIFHDDINPCRGRVQSVRLIEFGVGGDPFQEKRIERHAE